MNTYFDGQILTSKPEKSSIELPSQFQIGDDVEVVLDTGILQATVCAVKFSHVVSYDLAFPLGNGIYSVGTMVRGSMRAKGSEVSHLVEITTDSIAKLRRESMHLVD
jgi:hypothetical protein